MDAKKGKTCKESTPIKVWVTPEEKAAIAAKADAHSLSASSYLRRLGLAMPLQSTIDQRAILDLVRINADLGRFGGLIKMVKFQQRYQKRQAISLIPFDKLDFRTLGYPQNGAAFSPPIWGSNSDAVSRLLVREVILLKVSRNG
jgi:hypothetical protein